jgi:hypothetical protein
MPSDSSANPDRIALAAKISLVCPFVVVLIALLTHWLPPAFQAIGELAAGAVAVVGLICAITALAQARRSTSIAVQGGIGLVIGLVFVGVVLNNYLRAQQSVRAERGMDRSSDEPGMSPQAQRLSEAVARFIAKTTELEQRLVAAAKPLGTSPVLDLSGAKSTEDLLGRRSTVETYLAASHALSNHLAQAQPFLEHELTIRGATPAEAGGNAAGFLENIQAQLSTSRQIRELEHVYSQTLIQALDLLDEHWGAWQTQPQGTPLFETEEVALQYAALLKRLDELEARDRELKQQLSTP